MRERAEKAGPASAPVPSAKPRRVPGEPSITFHGAAGGVTGSCFLVEHGGGSFLVDCGMFQGSKTVRELNWRPFPFDPARIGTMLLTHAHIDHSGLIPKLVKAGFTGRVHCTRATADLLAYMLPDSGFIQEQDVRRLNLRNRLRGRGEVEPIYTREDAEASLDRLHGVDYGKWIEVQPGARARFWDAGHLLGSASIEVELTEAGRTTRILFSGDLGPDKKPFHDGPDGPEKMDWLVVESTYGGRQRPDVDEATRQAMLAEEVRSALALGGNLVIPAFAVERTQELLYDLDRLFDSGALPVTEVYLDSPLAVRITGVFEKYLPHVNQPGTPPPFRRGNLHLVESTEGSKRLNRLAGGAIIMAASGMCDAGRIRHHLKQNLWRRTSTVLFVGYQAPGTLGRVLQEGAKTVRIHGEEVQVHARIRTLDVYSGHADQTALLNWTRERMPVSRGVILTHGEESQRLALRDRLAGTGIDGARILTPALDERIVLTGSGEPPVEMVAERLPGGHLPERDWHNTYAETILALSQRLQTAPDDPTRADLLHRVRAALGLETA
ncbi:MBL fold metallo-hydrolase [Rhodocista pekingensis]|uniref:MBL fold metallo-hydrolase n=1 Tax=Rhodocista pekingensis TaxID=201185 RepID=A0ABW2L117_9PROT